MKAPTRMLSANKGFADKIVKPKTSSLSLSNSVVPWGAGKVPKVLKAVGKAFKKKDKPKKKTKPKKIFNKKWSVEEIKRLPDSENKGIKQITGTAKDAKVFFESQVISITVREVKKGTFIGKSSEGFTFTYRAVSKSGPPTIDINGIKGVRKIKFIQR